jgi:hypothetical protein
MQRYGATKREKEERRRKEEGRRKTNLEPIMPLPHHPIPHPHNSSSLSSPKSQMSHIPQYRWREVFLLYRIDLPLALSLAIVHIPVHIFENEVEGQRGHTSGSHVPIISVLSTSNSLDCPDPLLDTIRPFRRTLTPASNLQDQTLCLTTFFESLVSISLSLNDGREPSLK